MLRLAVRPVAAASRPRRPSAPRRLPLARDVPCCSLLAAPVRAAPRPACRAVRRAGSCCSRPPARAVPPALCRPPGDRPASRPRRPSAPRRLPLARAVPPAPCRPRCAARAVPPALCRPPVPPAR
ncbi:hypothetical protein [Kitasatospora sp. NPDC088783]|uniref:hypothetical protein n=1 Tax=Kitasatospora sp. NPDC088783 TaxID=3364077 RepID=UPI00381673BD